MTYNAVNSVSLERLAGRYSYLERKGLLPLPLKDGIAIVCELHHAEWAEECLRLLLLHSGSDVRIIAVPVEEQFAAVLLSERFAEEGPAVSFLPYGSKGDGVNKALAHAETSIVVLLEDSVMVTEGWLGDLLWPFVDDPAVGVVAPRSSMEEREGRERMHFHNFPELTAYVSHNRARSQGAWREAELLSGSCLLFTRELLLKVGGLDASLVERRLMMADWCLRARQLGNRLALSDAVYVHTLHSLEDEGGSSSAADQAARVEGQQAYRMKWGLPGGPATEGDLLCPADLSACPQQPVLPLSGDCSAAIPSVAAVVYSEEQGTAEAAQQRKQQLQTEQSWRNIRWVWVRDNSNDSVSAASFPVEERDAVITLQGEKPWLHALENASAFCDNDVVVYLSASAEYDSRYIERMAQALRHGAVDMISSGEAALQAPLAAGSRQPPVLRLECVAHRGGINPGRIARDVSGRSLLLYPAEACTIGYVAGWSGRDAVSGEGGELPS